MKSQTSNVSQLDRTLLTASKDGRIDLVTYWLERGGNVNVRDQVGKTLLHLAAANKHADLVKLLIKKGAKVEARDATARTPLMEAAHFGGAEAVRPLLAARANVNARNQWGYSALHFAASLGDTEVVKLLLDYKADPNITANDGATPYDICNAARIRALLQEATAALKRQAEYAANMQAAAIAAATPAKVAPTSGRTAVVAALGSTIGAKRKTVVKMGQAATLAGALNQGSLTQPAGVRAGGMLMQDVPDPKPGGQVESGALAALKRSRSVAREKKNRGLKGIVGSVFGWSPSKSRSNSMPNQDIPAIRASFPMPNTPTCSVSQSIESGIPSIRSPVSSSVFSQGQSESSIPLGPSDVSHTPRLHPLRRSDSSIPRLPLPIQDHAPTHNDPAAPGSPVPLSRAARRLAKAQQQNSSSRSSITQSSLSASISSTLEGIGKFSRGLPRRFVDAKKEEGRGAPLSDSVLPSTVEDASEGTDSPPQAVDARLRQSLQSVTQDETPELSAHEQMDAMQSVASFQPVSTRGRSISLVDSALDLLAAEEAAAAAAAGSGSTGHQRGSAHSDTIQQLRLLQNSMSQDVPTFAQRRVVPPNDITFPKPNVQPPSSLPSTPAREEEDVPLKSRRLTWAAAFAPPGTEPQVNKSWDVKDHYSAGVMLSPAESPSQPNAAESAHPDALKSPGKSVQSARQANRSRSFNSPSRQLAELPTPTPASPSDASGGMDRDEYTPSKDKKFPHKRSKSKSWARSDAWSKLAAQLDKLPGAASSSPLFSRSRHPTPQRSPPSHSQSSPLDQPTTSEHTTPPDSGRKKGRSLFGRRVKSHSHAGDGHVTTPPKCGVSDCVVPSARSLSAIPPAPLNIRTLRSDAMSRSFLSDWGCASKSSFIDISPSAMQDGQPFFLQQPSPSRKRQGISASEVSVISIDYSTTPTPLEALNQSNGLSSARSGAQSSDVSSEDRELAERRSSFRTLQRLVSGRETQQAHLISTQGEGGDEEEVTSAAVPLPPLANPTQSLGPATIPRPPNTQLSSSEMPSSRGASHAITQPSHLASPAAAMKLRTSSSEGAAAARGRVPPLPLELLQSSPTSSRGSAPHAKAYSSYSSSRLTSLTSLPSSEDDVGNETPVSLHSHDTTVLHTKQDNPAVIRHESDDTATVTGTLGSYETALMFSRTMEHDLSSPAAVPLSVKSHADLDFSGYALNEQPPAVGGVFHDVTKSLDMDDCFAIHDTDEEVSYFTPFQATVRDSVDSHTSHKSAQRDQSSRAQRSGRKRRSSHLLHADPEPRDDEFGERFGRRGSTEDSDVEAGDERFGERIRRRGSAEDYDAEARDEKFGERMKGSAEDSDADDDIIMGLQPGSYAPTPVTSAGSTPAKWSVHGRDSHLYRPLFSSNSACLDSELAPKLESRYCDHSSSSSSEDERTPRAKSRKHPIHALLDDAKLQNNASNAMDVAASLTLQPLSRMENILSSVSPESKDGNRQLVTDASMNSLSHLAAGGASPVQSLMSYHSTSSTSNALKSQLHTATPRLVESMATPGQALTPTTRDEHRQGKSPLGRMRLGGGTTQNAAQPAPSPLADTPSGEVSSIPARAHSAQSSAPVELTPATEAESDNLAEARVQPNHQSVAQTEPSDSSAAQLEWAHSAEAQVELGKPLAVQAEPRNLTQAQVDPHHPLEAQVDLERPLQAQVQPAPPLGVPSAAQQGKAVVSESGSTGLLILDERKVRAKPAKAQLTRLRITAKSPAQAELLQMDSPMGLLGIQLLTAYAAHSHTSSKSGSPQTSGLSITSGRASNSDVSVSPCGDESATSMALEGRGNSTLSHVGSGDESASSVAPNSQVQSSLSRAASEDESTASVSPTGQVQRTLSHTLGEVNNSPVYVSPAGHVHDAHPDTLNEVDDFATSASGNARVLGHPQQQSSLTPQSPPHHTISQWALNSDVSTLSSNQSYQKKKSVLTSIGLSMEALPTVMHEIDVTTLAHPSASQSPQVQGSSIIASPAPQSASQIAQVQGSSIIASPAPHSVSEIAQVQSPPSTASSTAHSAPLSHQSPSSAAERLSTFESKVSAAHKTDTFSIGSDDGDEFAKPLVTPSRSQVGVMDDLSDSSAPGLSIAADPLHKPSDMVLDGRNGSSAHQAYFNVAPQHMQVDAMDRFSDSPAFSVCSSTSQLVDIDNLGESLAFVNSAAFNPFTDKAEEAMAGLDDVSTLQNPFTIKAEEATKHFKHASAVRNALTVKVHKPIEGFDESSAVQTPCANKEDEMMDGFNDSPAFSTSAHFDTPCMLEATSTLVAVTYTGNASPAQPVDIAGVPPAEPETVLAAVATHPANQAADATMLAPGNNDTFRAEGLLPQAVDATMLALGNNDTFRAEALAPEPANQATDAPLPQSSMNDTFHAAALLPRPANLSTIPATTTDDRHAQKTPFESAAETNAEAESVSAQPVKDALHARHNSPSQPTSPPMPSPPLYHSLEVLSAAPPHDSARAAYATAPGKFETFAYPDKSCQGLALTAPSRAEADASPVFPCYSPAKAVYPTAFSRFDADASPVVPCRSPATAVPATAFSRFDADASPVVPCRSPATAVPATAFSRFDADASPVVPCRSPATAIPATVFSRFDADAYPVTPTATTPPSVSRSVDSMAFLRTKLPSPAASTKDKAGMAPLSPQALKSISRLCVKMPVGGSTAKVGYATSEVSQAASPQLAAPAKISHAMPEVSQVASPQLAAPSKIGHATSEVSQAASPQLAAPSKISHAISEVSQAASSQLAAPVKTSHAVPELVSDMPPMPAEPAKMHCIVPEVFPDVRQNLVQMHLSSLADVSGERELSGHTSSVKAGYSVFAKMAATEPSIRKAVDARQSYGEMQKVLEAAGKVQQQDQEQEYALELHVLQQLPVRVQHLDDWIAMMHKKEEPVRKDTKLEQDAVEASLIKMLLECGTEAGGVLSGFQDFHACHKGFLSAMASWVSQAESSMLKGSHSKGRESKTLVTGMQAVQPKLESLSHSVDRIMRRQLAMSDQEKRLQQWELKLSEKDAMLKDRDAKLRERDARVKERDAMLKQREARLKEREAKLEEREARLKEADAMLAQRSIAAVQQQPQQYLGSDGAAGQQRNLMDNPQASTHSHPHTPASHQHDSASPSSVPSYLSSPPASSETSSAVSSQLVTSALRRPAHARAPSEPLPELSLTSTDSSVYSEALSINSRVSLHSHNPDNNNPPIMKKSATADTTAAGISTHPMTPVSNTRSHAVSPEDAAANTDKLLTHTSSAEVFQSPTQSLPIGLHAEMTTAQVGTLLTHSSSTEVYQSPTPSLPPVGFQLGLSAAQDTTPFTYAPFGTPSPSTRIHSHSTAASQTNQAALFSYAFPDPASPLQFTSPVEQAHHMRSPSMPEFVSPLQDAESQREQSCSTGGTGTTLTHNQVSPDSADSLSYPSTKVVGYAKTSDHNLKHKVRSRTNWARKSLDMDRSFSSDGSMPDVWQQADVTNVLDQEAMVSRLQAMHQSLTSLERKFEPAAPLVAGSSKAGGSNSKDLRNGGGTVGLQSAPQQQWHKRPAHLVVPEDDGLFMLPMAPMVMYEQVLSTTPRPQSTRTLPGMPKSFNL